MPSIPTYTKCCHLGCKNHKSKLGAYCIEHGGRDNPIPTKDRQEFQSKYQTTQWRKLRQIQLSTQPLCQSCLSSGIVASAKHIDHVFPWSRIGDRAFYHNLFQSLCASCHSSKTYLEAQGIYRHYQGEVKDYALEDYARVVKS